MGGYSANTGSAWRWQVPEKYHELVQNKNNLLEFLASFITVWASILDGSAPHQSCFLALGDNSSAVGWLHKANVDEEQNKPLQAATRHFATILMNAHSCLYSQHIRGVHNNVADALSREHHLSDNDLIASISFLYPDQVPNTFKIDPLPQSILSWMTWFLQKISEQRESPQGHKRKRNDAGEDGKPISELLKTNTTQSSKSSNLPTEPVFLAPSQQLYDGVSFRELIQTTWQEAQSKRPWQSWVRSLGQTWGSTPTMERKERPLTLS
jgi:hypothetical protein